MKKLVFASVMVLASVCLASATALPAQDSDKITIKDPAEFNAYQNAVSQSDPKVKASSLESFLSTYPQSVVKTAVLEELIGTYQQMGDMDKTLSAATRLLQVDPNNPKAIFISVFIKKMQCAKTQDAQTCDDAAAIARKGLTLPKPKDVSDDEWKKQTSAMYPIFHSAMALDDVLAKKDAKAAVDEYRQELMLYPADATKSGQGLVDTLQLAETYIRLSSPDLPNAIWFYARAWNFAPSNFKAQIEQKLDFYYKKFHGGLDGLDAIKAQTASNLFPPGGAPEIKPAKTPAEFAHDVVSTTPDLATLNLSDKEFILANGTKDDADKLWAVMKDKVTPVPGVVLEASSTVIKIAVSQDAKTANRPDFIVNMKKPLEEKEIPAVGFEYKIPPDTALIGIYDSYKQVPATETTAQTAEIVLRDGEIRPEEKKAPHKPAAGHHRTN